MDCDVRQGEAKSAVKKLCVSVSLLLIVFYIMDHLQHILAASDDGGSTVKIVIGLVFAGIWVIAQILASVGKKKDKTRPASGNQPIVLPHEMAQPPASAPRQQPPVQKRIETKQQQRLEKQNRQRMQQQRIDQQPQMPTRSSTPSRQSPPPPIRQQRQTAPSMRPAVALPPDSPIAATAFGTRSQQASRTNTGPTPAHRLHAILRPGNMQKEFILTEILQPPLSQRPDRHDS